MFVLPYQNLPNYYTRLLKIDMRPTPRNFLSFEAYVRSNASLSALMKRYFLDIDPKGRVEVIIRTLGFLEIRNRLASVFIYHELEGKFAEQLPLDYSREIRDFEDRVREYTAQGHSRDFMLGFYLYMINIKSQKKIEISTEVIKLLTLSKSKVKKIDILLIVLMCFSELLGFQVLKGKIEEGATYKLLYALLDAEKKTIFMENLLAYSYSIGERSVFVEEVID